ncbi:MAG: ATP-binding protein [bacterium]
MSTSETKRFEIVIPSKLDRIESVEKLSERAADVMQFSDDEKDSLAIAVTEAVNNAIIHGNKRDASKKVFINFKFEGKKLIVIVKDEGQGFDPNDLRDPLDPQNLLKESGRGIFILKALMDEVNFEFEKGGTVIKMAKEKKS